MRTIGSHLRSDRRRDDFIATCDICGNEYLHSDLHRDDEGLLRCPADLDGRSVVTLSQANADALGRSQYDDNIPYQGRRPSEGRELADSPMTILGIDEVAGWWHLDAGVRLAPTQTDWTDMEDPSRPSVHGVYDGNSDDNYAVTSAMPVKNSAGTVVDFNYQPIWSSQAPITLAGTNPTLWVVGYLSTGQSGFAGMVSFTDAPPSHALNRGFQSYVASTSLMTVFGAATPGTAIRAAIKYRTAGSVTVTGPTEDGALHVFMLSAEASRAVFTVDGVEYDSASPSGDVVEAITIGVFGAGGLFGGEGPGQPHIPGLSGIAEVVMQRDIPTAAEKASMLTYFARRHPGLSL